MITIIPNWHPIFVHFTIGLLGISVFFYLASSFLPVSDELKKNWQIVARWCLWSGMAVTLITLTAGYFAYNSVAHDTPSHEAMTEHRNWAFATAGCFALLTLWSIWLHMKEQAPGIIFLLFALLSGGLLASTGWHGGEAVYRYGLGVMSLPQSEGEGHAHEHPGGSEHESSSENVATKSNEDEQSHEHSSGSNHEPSSESPMIESNEDGHEHSEDSQHESETNKPGMSEAAKPMEQAPKSNGHDQPHAH